MLSPQQLTSPEDSRAQLWPRSTKWKRLERKNWPPAVTAVTPDRVPVPEVPTTATGMRLSAVELFPSWPRALLPQQSTPEEESRAQLWRPPAATAVTPDRVPVPEVPTTATG